jgi:antitoxin (DNA-binding transcriptional repressor) of toxin-antitoxin stability system
MGGAPGANGLRLPKAIDKTALNVHPVRCELYIMLQSKIMEVPITRFRQKLFDFVNQALDGKEVWVSHKGRRVRLVPEHAPSKLSRVTPMQIIVSGADLEDDSWKEEMVREWERKWDRRLGPLAKPARAASEPDRTRARKTRRTA